MNPTSAPQYDHSPGFFMIPEAKRAAVFRGLHEAFGTTTIEGIYAITKGLSTDLVYRIVASAVTSNPANGGQSKTGQ